LTKQRIKKKIDLTLTPLKYENQINFKNGYLEYDKDLVYNKSTYKKKPFHKQVILNELYPISRGRNVNSKATLKRFSEDIKNFIINDSSDVINQAGRKKKSKLTKRHVLDFLNDVINGLCSQLNLDQLQSIKRQCSYQINLFDKKIKNSMKKREPKISYCKVFTEESNKYIPGQYNENDFEDFS